MSNTRTAEEKNNEQTIDPKAEQTVEHKVEQKAEQTVGQKLGHTLDSITLKIKNIIKPQDKQPQEEKAPKQHEGQTASANNSVAGDSTNNTGTQTPGEQETTNNTSDTSKSSTSSNEDTKTEDATDAKKDSNSNTVITNTLNSTNSTQAESKQSTPPASPKLIARIKSAGSDKNLTNKSEDEQVAQSTIQTITTPPATTVKTPPTPKNQPATITSPTSSQTNSSQKETGLPDKGLPVQRTNKTKAAKIESSQGSLTAADTQKASLTEEATQKLKQRKSAPEIPTVHTPREKGKSSSEVIEVSDIDAEIFEKQFNTKRQNIKQLHYELFRETLKKNSDNYIDYMHTFYSAIKNPGVDDTNNYVNLLLAVHNKAKDTVQVAPTPVDLFRTIRKICEHDDIWKSAGTQGWFKKTPVTPKGIKSIAEFDLSKEEHSLEKHIRELVKEKNKISDRIANSDQRESITQSFYTLLNTLITLHDTSSSEKGNEKETSNVNADSSAIQYAIADALTGWCNKYKFDMNSLRVNVGEEVETIYEKTASLTS